MLQVDLNDDLINTIVIRKCLPVRKQVRNRGADDKCSLKTKLTDFVAANNPNTNAAVPWTDFLCPGHLIVP